MIKSISHSANKPEILYQIKLWRPLTLLVPQQSRKLPDYKGHFPPIRDYIDINITGNNYNDKIKLEFAQIRIREILSENNTTSGIHFLFGDSTQYGKFLEVLNILLIERAKNYIPGNNDLWFFSFQMEATLDKPTINCLANDIMDIMPML